MSIREREQRLRKIADRLHSTARPKPSLVKLCDSEIDVQAAEREFLEANGKYDQLIVVQAQDMSLPWPEEEK